MRIYIDNRQETFSTDPEVIREKAQAVLNALESPDAELSIVLVDDDEIARLNQTFLNRSGPTNVIAFPMREGLFGDVNPHVLGDVVISTETAAREAKQGGMKTDMRFEQLLIHGILHLFGYDHEKDPEQERVMSDKEKEMMALLQTYPQP